jgi:hypothetical protein
MKRVIAELLRKRTTWQLVAIAAVCTIVGLLITYNVYTTTRKAISPLLTVIFGVGGAALVLALVRRGEEVERGGPALRLWMTLLAGVLAIAGLIAVGTYSFGHFKTKMISGCNASVLPDTLSARKEALAEAEARLWHPFAWLPGLVDGAAARECERSRNDLARVEQGLCTRWPLVDQTCRCGDESYPYARCAEPNCLYAPGLPDKFDCVGVDIPDGYIGH